MSDRTPRTYALIAVPILMIGFLGATQAHADAALFKEKCAKCHARASALASSLKGRTVDEKASQLDTLLKSHHAEDAEARAKIVAYLVALTKS